MDLGPTSVNLRDTAALAGTVFADLRETLSQEIQISDPEGDHKCNLSNYILEWLILEK